MTRFLVVLITAQLDIVLIPSKLNWMCVKLILEKFSNVNDILQYQGQHKGFVSSEKVINWK